MEFKVDKEFILQAHKEACGQWKRIIKDKFPDAFEPQLEVGKWYKNKHGGIACYTGKDVAYGFNSRGEWHKNKLWSFDVKNAYKPITSHVAAKALIKEAEERGLVEGVRYMIPQGGSTEIAKGKLKMSSDLDHLYYDDSCHMIFHNGKWAEPIEDETQKKIEELQRQLDELKQKL